MQTTDFNFPDIAIIPTPLAEAEAILREHAATGEWWLIVCDGDGFALTEKIIRRHYEDATSEDYFACAILYTTGALTVVALRRRLMSARQYRWELAKQGTNRAERELVACGALLLVDAGSLPAAHRLARELLGCEPVGDLAMET